MILAGSVLLLAPTALELGFAPIITGMIVGAIAAGLGIAGTATQGRGTIPLTAHAVYDRALAIGLLLVAVLFGAIDENVAAALFGGAGIAALAMTLVTRYTAEPA